MIAKSCFSVGVLFFGALLSLATLASAASLAGQWPRVDSIVFEPGPAPGKENSFPGGVYRTYYRQQGKGKHQGIGYAFLYVTYTKKKADHLPVTVWFEFKTKDLIGMFGGVFRVQYCDGGARLQRVREKQLPDGLRPPQEDSIIIQLSTSSGVLTEFHETQVRAVSMRIASEANKNKATALLRIVEIGKKSIGFAKVQAGDIVLVNHKGHEVRAVVPRDRFPADGVVGWVELGSEYVPEADLIRDKKAFVRPIPEKTADQMPK